MLTSKTKMRSLIGITVNDVRLTVQGIATCILLNILVTKK